MSSKRSKKNPPDFPGAEDVIEDVHLIRSQLDRCRAILDRMASHAGEAIGEPIQPVAVASLSNLLLEGLRGQGRVQLFLPDEAHQENLNIPLIGLSQAMRGLVQNALDADRSDRSVMVSVARHAQDWEWKNTRPGARHVGGRAQPCQRTFLHDQSTGGRNGLRGSSSPKMSFAALAELSSLNR